MKNNVLQAVNYIKSLITQTPEYVIVLGSGLKNLINEVQNPLCIPYSQIPNFPKVTVAGHGGELIYGTLSGKKVMMMSGRFHYYEGYNMDQITLAMRVFGVLGIKKVILSNAAGGVNKSFKIGDVMLINDHINMMPEHPLRGENIDEWGPRFLDMSQAYDKNILNSAISFCEQQNITIQKGIYLALQGPTFETPAEYGMIKNMGADAVGMSTVPEVIVARHMNMQVFALSVITDLGGPDIQTPVSHQEVLHAADVAMPKVIRIVKHVVANN